MCAPREYYELRSSYFLRTVGRARRSFLPPGVLRTLKKTRPRVVRHLARCARKVWNILQRKGADREVGTA